MARLLRLQAQRPTIIEVGGEKKAICACGLTSNFPYCNGAHKRTLDEEDGKTYRYGDEGRTEVNV